MPQPQPLTPVRRMPDPAVACLAVPSLAFECELVERPELCHEPAALASEDGQRVVEATRRARAYGVRVGMTLREAVACCPTLSVIEPRPAYVARIAEALVEAMEQISPLVEEVEPGIIFADLRGTGQLYPDPHTFANTVFDVVQGVLAMKLASSLAGLRPRLGIASTRFSARVVAVTAEPGVSCCVPPGGDAAFLEPLPVAWLPLASDDIEHLRLLGIGTCGDLASLPRHAVEAQFGVEGGRAWLASRGEDPEPVRPRPWERERVVEYVQAEPPLVSRESVALALEQLLGRALRHPRAAHRFVRFVRLHGETERGGLWGRTQVLREPAGDRTRLWTVIRSLIEYAEFPGPLVELSLELGGLTAESGRQRSLFDAERTRRREQLDEMVRHLKVRFGQSPMARVVAVEPDHRLPERRYALMDYDP